MSAIQRGPTLHRASTNSCQRVLTTPPTLRSTYLATLKPTLSKITYVVCPCQPIYIARALCNRIFTEFMALRAVT